jgi:ribose transport system permease protein
MTAGHDIGVKAVPPDKADEKLRPTAAARLRTTILHVLSVHGLFVFGILLVIIFSILLPSTFTGTQTFRAILGNNTTVALLAMAEMIVIATGNYDLSIAYNVGLMHITAMGLLTDADVPWPLVVVLTSRHRRPGRLGQRPSGRIRPGRLVHRDPRRRHDPLRPRHLVHQRHPARRQRAAAFADLNCKVLSIPLPTYMVAAVAILAWGALEHVPIGRQLYAIGSNRKAAELTGIRARRLVMGSFVCSGLIVGLAGVLLAARLQVAQSSVGPEFLLPAFVAPLARPSGQPGEPGAHHRRPGAGVGIAGLRQLGNSFFVEPIFRARR